MAHPKADGNEPPKAPAPPSVNPAPLAPPVITVSGVVAEAPAPVAPPPPAPPKPAAPEVLPPVSFVPQPVTALPGELPGARVEGPAAVALRDAREPAPAGILVIDIGGTKVKMLAKGQTEPRKVPSGKQFTPAKLVEAIRLLPGDWEYDAISIGYPGQVGAHGPRSEPGNLGPGWVGFDFSAALDKPVKIINDAVMQALGSYDGGRMLFLGLGTGLGSALIAGQVIVPLELGRLRYDDDRMLGEVLGRRGLEAIGRRSWRRAVTATITTMMHAFLADYVVIGGGNAKMVKELPPGVRLGNNLTAFRGGYRLWGVEDVWVMASPGGETPEPTAQEALRVV